MEGGREVEAASKRTRPGLWGEGLCKVSNGVGPFGGPSARHIWRAAVDRTVGGQKGRGSLEAPGVPCQSAIGKGWG